MKPIILLTALALSAGAEPPSLSGIHPHLAMFNDERECGTGAVVPWADRLWVITYAPHMPKGSSDKLYEITPDLRQIIRPESTGGTPANRMIHEESGQLFIGPYAIDQKRTVRTIPYSAMFGRPTGTARHLDDPEGKVLHATMEEGIYEVDVASLEVRELWADEAVNTDRRKSGLPGYHGKGFYSGQGVYVYANNGERGTAAKTDPTTPSGVLAEWDGQADTWTVVRRNQFTEVTGPGGIHGNPNPETDPIWTIGWDAKSLLLGVRRPDDGWQFFRLPKGSHSYDGAHGWNTEWPRIREIGEDDLLMTMHGTFWRFPADFGVASFGGIRPRSNYLKVIGDFCRWNDRIVFGCDDTAKSEFLNKRKAKGEIAAPQSQSNLWFVEADTLDSIGPVIGRGAVWLAEDVDAGAISDPYLLAGYAKRGLHLHHAGDSKRTIQLELLAADQSILSTKKVEIPGSGYHFVDLAFAESGEWIRLRALDALSGASAVLTYGNEDPRTEEADPIFNGVAGPDTARSGGLVRARDKGHKTLSLAAIDAHGKPAGYYEMGADLKLERIDDPDRDAFTRKHTAIPADALIEDEASVIYTDNHGKRWRLPKGDVDGLSDFGAYRVAREVATERDLLHADGSFYELPALNAGGIAKVRPVATHNRLVHDFCSYRGLFIMSGIAVDSPERNPHIIRSADGKAALWAGAIDDVWKLGKPRGEGGPWKATQVKAGIPSDPYLVTGYDKKSLRLAVAEKSANITVQIDIHGDGTWVDCCEFHVGLGSLVQHDFPDAFSAYWIRFVSDQDTVATAQLTYR